MWLCPTIIFTSGYLRIFYLLQLFDKRKKVEIENKSKYTCIFNELHPPRHPIMCHDRIVCTVRQVKSQVS